jgi:hypothetical protein
MEFQIWVEVHLAGRVLDRQLVAQVDREATGIGPEEIGLTLEEGKTVKSAGPDSVLIWQDVFNTSASISRKIDRFGTGSQHEGRSSS